MITAILCLICIIMALMCIQIRNLWKGHEEAMVLFSKFSHSEVIRETEMQALQTEQQMFIIQTRKLIDKLHQEISMPKP